MASAVGEFRPGTAVGLPNVVSTEYTIGNLASLEHAQREDAISGEHVKELHREYWQTNDEIR